MDSLESISSLEFLIPYSLRKEATVSPKTLSRVSIERNERKTNDDYFGKKNYTIYDH